MDAEGRLGVDRLGRLTGDGLADGLKGVKVFGGGGGMKVEPCESCVGGGGMKVEVCECCVGGGGMKDELCCVGGADSADDDPREVE